ncbi:MAG: hypothetical protein ACOC3Z_02100 [Nanoarchaeota archaeon]
MKNVVSIKVEMKVSNIQRVINMKLGKELKKMVNSSGNVNISLSKLEKMFDEIIKEKGYMIDEETKSYLFDKTKVYMNRKWKTNYRTLSTDNVKHKKILKNKGKTHFKYYTVKGVINRKIGLEFKKYKSLENVDEFHIRGLFDDFIFDLGYEFKDNKYMEMLYNDCKTYIKTKFNVSI